MGSIGNQGDEGSPTGRLTLDDNLDDSVLDLLLHNIHIDDELPDGSPADKLRALFVDLFSDTGDNAPLVVLPGSTPVSSPESRADQIVVAIIELIQQEVRGERLARNPPAVEGPPPT